MSLFDQPNENTRKSGQSEPPATVWHAETAAANADGSLALEENLGGGGLAAAGLMFWRRKPSLLETWTPASPTESTLATGELQWGKFMGYSGQHRDWPLYSGQVLGEGGQTTDVFIRPLGEAGRDKRFLYDAGMSHLNRQLGNAQGALNNGLRLEQMDDGKQVAVWVQESAGRPASEALAQLAHASQQNSTQAIAKLIGENPKLYANLERNSITGLLMGDPDRHLANSGFRMVAGEMENPMFDAGRAFRIRGKVPSWLMFNDAGFADPVIQTFAGKRISPAAMEDLGRLVKSGATSEGFEALRAAFFTSGEAKIILSRAAWLVEHRIFPR